MTKICSFCGFTTESTEPACGRCGAPNDAYSPLVGGTGGSASGGPWGFESSISGCGDRMVGSLGINRTGAPMGLLEMMIRGAFLDGAVYRQAAADTGGNGNALIALCISVAAGMLGGVLSLLLVGAHYFVSRGILVLV